MAPKAARPVSGPATNHILGVRATSGASAPGGALTYRQQGAAAVLTLPNLITIARLCVVPLSVWLVLRHDFPVAFWLFVAAGISDAVDGWLARRGAASALGAILDPLADKALLVSMFVTLGAIGALPDWLAILVVFRDVLIVGGVLALYVLGQKVAIRPLPISKLNTVTQILLIAATLGFGAFAIHAQTLQAALIWIATATTLTSGAAYVWQGALAR